jgi:hypothetical protein
MSNATKHLPLITYHLACSVLREFAFELRDEKLVVEDRRARKFVTTSLVEVLPETSMLLDLCCRRDT